MILDQKLVTEAMIRHKPIEKLIKSSDRKLIKNYRVADYITSENLPEVLVNGSHPAKIPVSAFFKKSQYLMNFDIYNGAGKKFPYKHVIHFFDTYLVVEIEPDTLMTEFLVIAPVKQNNNEVLSGMMSSTAVTSLFSFASQHHKVELALNMAVDHLLEYLRSGYGRKKVLGLF